MVDRSSRHTFFFYFSWLRFSCSRNQVVNVGSGGDGGGGPGVWARRLCARRWAFLLRSELAKLSNGNDNFVLM